MKGGVNGCKIRFSKRKSEAFPKKTFILLGFTSNYRLFYLHLGLHLTILEVILYKYGLFTASRGFNNIFLINCSDPRMLFYWILFGADAPKVIIVR